MYTGILVFFAVFLKNRSIITKIKISKVTDYAALNVYIDLDSFYNTKAVMHTSCKYIIFNITKYKLFTKACLIEVD